VVDVPVSFGSSSTTFLEDVYDQIVPPPTKMKRRREERNRRWIDEGHDWFGLNDIRR
jgi:hypothetical protein